MKFSVGGLGFFVCEFVFFLFVCLLGFIYREIELLLKDCNVAFSSDTASETASETC